MRGRWELLNAEQSFRKMGGGWEREREHRGDCWDRPRALWVIGGSGARERQSWPVVAGTEGRCICQQ